MKKEQEEKRLEALAEYNIMDTFAESEFDDIVTLASAICGMPISLISLVDSERQWFKAKVGLGAEQTPREQAFCAHAINKPDEVMVVENPTEDERFKDNPLVLGDPNIRFYAGAPLLTPEGHALGTLCVIDDKPRELSPEQLEGLRILSKRVMEHLENRKVLLSQKKEIKESAKLLKYLTDNTPGALFQFELAPDETSVFSFISKGIENLHPELTPKKLKENSWAGFRIIHPDDLERVQAAIEVSKNELTQLELEYRIVLPDGKLRWNSATARPEKRSNGTVVWYGIFQDITESKEYQKTLEGISYSISHIIRRPVANLIGLSEMLEKEKLTKEKAREYAGYFKNVTEELDGFINVLSETYNEKRLKFRS